MDESKSLDEIFAQTKGESISFMGKTLVRIDRIPVSKTQFVRVSFLETNSDWKQGLVLETKGDLILEGMEFPFRIVLWKDTAPKQIDIQLKTKDKELIVYNVWDVGNGTMHYWHNGGAMEVKVKGTSRTYYCNDGYPDMDFNDLIFSVELLND